MAVTWYFGLQQRAMIMRTHNQAQNVYTICNLVALGELISTAKNSDIATVTKLVT